MSLANRLLSAPDESGLSAATAAQRLRDEGYNELAPPLRRSFLMLFGEALHEPMFLLLLGAGGVYLLLGDKADALLLLGFVFVLLTLTVTQEWRTSRVLDRLRDLASPRATVVRDGSAQRVPGREVVRGDLLLLAEGDRVAADGLIVDCHHLVVDESILSGEAVPVNKFPVAAPGVEPAAARVSAGTLVVQGGARVRVEAIGRASALGRIGASLAAIAEPPTPLQRQFAELVKRFAKIGLGASGLLLLFQLLGGTAWLPALLAAITLSMSLLPEELPVIVAVFFALGAWRISQQRVLTRRQAAIETLGATTALCVDKTGTLTENRMSIARLWREGDDGGGSGGLAVGGLAELPEDYHRLIEFAILASQRAPFDPMEQAFHAVGDALLEGTEHLHGDWQIVHEYSLSPGLLAMAHIWRGEGEMAHAVATKGAPEAVVDLCHLPAERAAAILAAAEALAGRGLRVLGVARAQLPAGSEWPAQLHDIPFDFVGLVGLEDPLRAGVADAIRVAREAGCRVLVISGDYPRTAQAVARAIGLADDAVVSGDELDRLSDAALAQRVRQVDVYARIRPEQKLRLVQALRANGEVVAMTGDGVNDAPALRAAHIGVAMGRRGSDVAREAAGLVLLDDDFAALVATMGLGRRVFDNLRKALSYTLAVHLPIAGMALLPALLGQPLMLIPALIMFFELIIGPSCSLVFEAEPAEPGHMRRPPRRGDEALFGGRRMRRALAQGGIVLAVNAAAYLWSLHLAWSAEQSRALVFVVMLGGNLSLLAACRSGSRSLWLGLGRGNPVFWWICGGALAGLALISQSPLLLGLFHLATLGPAAWSLAALACAAQLLGLELLRLGLARRAAHPL